MLISSDSKTLLDKKIKEIIGESTNVLKYPFGETSMTDILEEASYVSMFEEEKFLIVKNADFFGKEKLNEKDSEKLMKYLENPYPLTTLIFTTYEPCDQRKSITKKIQEVGEFYFIKAPKNYELNEEIKKLLHHYKVDDATIRYINEACLGNYDIIVNEIGKLDLYFEKGSTISLDQMKNIIVSNVNDNVFKFVDAVVSKDYRTTFQLLNDFEVIKIDVFQLVNVLAREYRLMFYYKILERKKYNRGDMAKSMKLQDWQLENVRKEAMNYHMDDLKDFLVELSKLDTAMKNGTYEKNLAFTNFLMHAME